MVPVLGRNRASDQMNQANDVCIVGALEPCTFPCVHVDDLAPLYDPDSGTHI